MLAPVGFLDGAERREFVAAQARHWLQAFWGRHSCAGGASTCSANRTAAAIDAAVTVALGIFRTHAAEYCALLADKYRAAAAAGGNAGGRVASLAAALGAVRDRLVLDEHSGCGDRHGLASWKEGDLLRLVRDNRAPPAGS